MKLLLFLSLAIPSWGAWGYYFSSTPDTGKVSSGPHTDFPALIDITHNDLRVTGSGGLVTDAQGDDIAPYADASCSTLLPFELVAYDGTTGRWRAWVNVASLSSASTVRTCFQNASQTTSLQNVSGTWNSGYAAVYHHGDGSTCGVSDSTSNGLTLTNTGTVNGTTGQIYGACGTNWSTSVYLSRASASALVFSGSWTVSAWVNPSACNAYPQVVFKGQSATRNYELDLGNSNCKIRANMTQSAVEKTATATNAISTGVWTHIGGRYNGSNIQAFVNGAPDGSSVAATGSPDTDTNTLKVGVYESGGIYSGPFPGGIDELRISNVARSDGWMATEHNVGTPSTFWVTSGPTAVAAPSRRMIIVQ